MKHNIKEVKGSKGWALFESSMLVLDLHVDGVPYPTITDSRKLIEPAKKQLVGSVVKRVFIIPIPRGMKPKGRVNTPSTHGKST